MGRTLTALIAAGALVLAACGDDSGDEEEEGTDETEETADEGDGEAEGDEEGDEEVVDSGTGEGDEAAAGDAEEFCAAAQTGDPEEMSTVTPPAEIADAWNEVMADPEAVDTGSEAVAEITDWIGANCAAPGTDGETGTAEPGDTADPGTGDVEAGGTEGGSAPGEDGFMEDFCVDLPEGVDSDVAC